jgi:hypothetical protein
MTRRDLKYARPAANRLVALALLAGATSCRDQPRATSDANASVRCPSVALEISSFDSELGGAIEVRAGAADPGPGAPVVYAWSATAGAFDDPTALATAYSCPPTGDAGPQIIRVSASRGACTVSQQLVVICFAPLVDAGAGGEGGSTGGDGSGGAAGVGGAGAGAGGGGGGTSTPDGGCGIDPTTDEGNSCNQCTAANCTILENAQPDVPPTAGCHHLASDRERQSCQALYCCMRSNRCVAGGDPTPCWCGSADPTECARGQAPANGPCAREIEAAAGTTEAPEIALRLIDPTFPLGGAANLAICRATFCATPPSPACQGF